MGTMETVTNRAQSQDPLQGDRYHTLLGKVSSKKSGCGGSAKLELFITAGRSGPEPHVTAVSLVLSTQAKEWHLNHIPQR